MKMNESKDKFGAANHKWGELKLDKLPKEIDTAWLKQQKPVLIDQPLLPSILTPDVPRPLAKKPNSSQSTLKSSNSSRIDSYIINTIKLNQILKNRVCFDKVKWFRKPTGSKNLSSKPRRSRNPATIDSSDQARAYLRQFVTIMCLHIDFSEVSSIALDILVDLLEHFLESFFKLMKNLKSVHLFDVQDVNTDLGVSASYYHSENYVEQALQELGLGSIKNLKDYYLNDIVVYYRTTYDKVNKMYEAYKKSKMGLKPDGNTDLNLGSQMDTDQRETNHSDLEIDEFMKNNELLNDESDLILGEFLNDLNSSHLDEEINKMLQMIGPDPFCLLSDEN